MDITFQSMSVCVFSITFNLMSSVQSVILILINIKFTFIFFQFFKLDLHKGDTLLTEDELVCQLRSIVDMSSEENEYPVGVLTAQDRNVWAQGYKRLARGDFSHKILQTFCMELMSI